MASNILELTVDATIASFSVTIAGIMSGQFDIVKDLPTGLPDCWNLYNAHHARRVPNWSPEKIFHSLLLLGEHQVSARNLMHGAYIHSLPSSKSISVRVLGKNVRCPSLLSLI